MSELYSESMKTSVAAQETNTNAAAATPPNTVALPNPPEPPNPPKNQASGQNDLLNVVVKDENSALNTMVGFLGLAQKRGAFAINESAKIYECIKIFCKGAMSTTSK